MYKIVGSIYKGIPKIEEVLSEIIDDNGKDLGITIVDGNYILTEVPVDDGVYHFANADDIGYYVDKYSLDYELPTMVDWDIYLNDTELQDNYDDYISFMYNQEYAVYFRISVITVFGSKRVLRLWHPDVGTFVD